ncbi:hypothetical protein [Pseudarthrobacter enclensis]|uniref:hypothetical protein n=1 Tax=Pseudarthrobacter enclensis TaxID=993070 RepID=UPI003EE11F16
MTLPPRYTVIGASDRPGASPWLGIAWLLVAACLGVMSWTLLQLDSAHIYVLPAPDISGVYLGAALSLMALAPAIAGICLSVRHVTARTPRRWAVVLARTLGWVSGFCAGLAYLYLALALFLAAPVAAHTLESPHDGRRVLMVNRTVLIAGGFAIYEPKEWPFYTQVGSLTTNNAYDPFRAGAYRATWTNEGLDLEYVRDYMKPDEYAHEFIALRP